MIEDDWNILSDVFYDLNVLMKKKGTSYSSFDDSIYGVRL